MPSSRALNSADLQLLQDKATHLRIDSVQATTAAGSGHPTSCASAAEIMSALFFSVMRYDPRNPHSAANDVFVLSKGHAAPILYAAWAEAGAFPGEKLLSLRQLNSDLEGHPMPELPFVDVATGSLGQGLSVAVGMAVHAKRFQRSDQRVYVLLGDGESAEGSNWEAAQWASFHQLDNLCVTIDINRLGQSQPTMLQDHLETYRARWEAFGWQAIPVDGHNLSELLAAYDRARRASRPTVVLAQTIKGKGLPGIEGKEGWHGKALDRETANSAIAELRHQLDGAHGEWRPNLPDPVSVPPLPELNREAALPPYAIGGKAVSARKGFGDGLAAVARGNPRVVAIDGDVKNSTFTEELEKAAPEHFLQGYIAEQNMVGMAMGLAARGHIPFVATFACFLTRAYDFIRMTAVSQLNVKFVGTHPGVSIGEDGPSQMGLEDLAMMCAEPNMTVLYPADATSAWKATELLAEHTGPCYLRAGRPNTPILYSPDEPFSIGRCKVLRRSDKDRALIVAAGVTVHEALKAHEQLRQQGIAVRVMDLFSVQPIDREELLSSAREAGGVVITVEDHYQHGGLGDAVLAALAQQSAKDQKPARVHKLAVKRIPHSGKPEELIDTFGISAKHILQAVRAALDT
jgi:transketolase